MKSDDRDAICRLLANGTSPRFLALAIRLREARSIYYKHYDRLKEENGDTWETLEAAAECNPYYYDLYKYLHRKAVLMYKNGTMFNIGEGTFGHAAEIATSQDNYKKKRASGREVYHYG